MTTWLLIGDGYVRSDQIESLSEHDTADGPATTVRLISGSVWVLRGMTPRQSLNWIRAAESASG
jgi:hypothetical protein